MNQNEKDQLIERFVTVTNSSPYLAEQYLARNENDLMNAIEDYFASNTKSSGSTPTSTTKHKSGVRTFKDLNEGDDEDDKTDTNFFTGGEKSALQVEDPNKDKKSGRSLIDDIFQKAREQMSQPDDRPSTGEPETAAAPTFVGTGYKLGDGEAPSQTIPDVNAHASRKPTLVKREITFWKQGFTVGEGHLRRYDDPANAGLLEELNRGRVPLALLDVEFGQDVDVSVIRKTDEDYKPPKRKLGGFGGSGHRLGSPVPGEPIVTPDPRPVEVKTTPVVAPEPEAQGDTPVQIRFANGKKVNKRFNSSDSISVVYEFVQSHEFSDASRPFILSHAFPVKPIENSSDISVADAKLKNAVIVQRWN